MSSREAWLRSKVAPTTDALEAGDGCHADEAKALDDFLSGALSPQEAAKRITDPLSLASTPSAELHRPWSLLCEALVELGRDDRRKTLDLLSAVQALPSSSGIEWSQLPGFGHMWSDLYRLHLHGPDPWEKESLTDERRADLRRDFEAIGTAEAEMYVRRLPCVTADWGYEVLNLVCAKRSGIDVLLGEIHSWLKVAGTKLKESMNPEETRSYPRAVVDGRPGEQRPVSGTMVEHWASWEKALLELSADGCSLSKEGSRLAAECHELMR